MTIFETMLAQREVCSQQDELLAIREIVQQITLAGLARCGFFKHAAFYGGTCLRIFHGLPRFSEDMDFSLLSPDKDFQLENYFDGIHDIFRSMGLNIELSRKQKRHVSAIQSAFLKSDTTQYDLRLERGRLIKVKLEVDTSPPLRFDTEWNELSLPETFPVRCFTLPCLFAGKLHALIYRAWGHRVKGRDWYDFEWYVKNNVPLHFKHFTERARNIGDNAPANAEQMLSELRERIQKVHISDVKLDVEPFIKDYHSMDAWSTAYFMDLAQQMVIDL